MKILLTRPLGEARRSAVRLQRLGYQPILAPVLSIEAVPFEWPSQHPDALLVTSARALPFLEKAGRDLPVFTLGEASATALREAGFRSVTVFVGDGAQMAAALVTHFPERQHFLHIAGEDHKAEPAEILRRNGHQVSSLIVYRARAQETLPDEAIHFLEEPGGIVLHYSRRSAEILLLLARRARCEAGLVAKSHFVFSSDVAEPLRQAGATSVAQAKAPDEEALMEILMQELSARQPSYPEASHPQGSDFSAQHAPFLSLIPGPVIESQPLRSRKRIGELALAACIGGLLGAFLVLALWSKPYDPLPRLADNERRLSLVESRTKNLPSRLDTLEQVHKTLDAAHLQIRQSLQEESVRLSSEIARRDAISAIPVRENTSTEWRKALLVFRLEQALLGGFPYKTMFEALSPHLTEEDKNTLLPFAETGFPTPDKLMAQFQPFAGGLASLTGSRWQESAIEDWGWLSRFLTIRNISGVKKDQLRKTVEDALRTSDWKKAQELLETLPSSDRVSLEPFLGTLKALIQARKTVNDLVTQAVQGQ
jgi:uroporphyrinogen-III synthase